MALRKLRILTILCRKVHCGTVSGTWCRSGIGSAALRRPSGRPGYASTVEPMTDVLMAYRVFDQRKPGWVKVELVPGI
jgi:hypothetical protein